MRNIVVQLAYDGTNLVGSQVQASGRSVQGELEQAWHRFTGEQQRWTLAGRTDAGVHAHGQVANVRTATTHTLTTIQRALNAILPRDIAVRNVWDAEPEFHARFSALRREYRYTILNDQVLAPLLRTTSWHVSDELDVRAMDQTVQLLLGEHDFAPFGVVDRGSTVRTCVLAGCRVEIRDGSQLIQIGLAANGFLRHMVRAVVGTLVEVGRGRWTPAMVGEALASRDRRRAGPTAPPHGLSLMAVMYPDNLLGKQKIPASRSEPKG